MREMPKMVLTDSINAYLQAYCTWAAYQINANLFCIRISAIPW